VVTWYHLAFFVISSAMFGMTAGAVWVYLRKDRFDGRYLSYDLAWMSTCFGLSTALSLIVQSTLAFAFVGSLALILVFVEAALAIATPFFFSGAAISLALTRSPFPVGRVYAADLAGAALGCLAVLAVLGPLDASSSILLAGAGGAVAAIFFSRSAIGGSPDHEKRTAALVAKQRWVAIALFAAAVANGVTGHGIQPIIVKERVEGRLGGITFEQWNSFSRIIALAPSVGRPFLWGPSSRVPTDIDAEQIALNIDGVIRGNILATTTLMTCFLLPSFSFWSRLSYPLPRP
jgi:hypothetical protein